MEKTNKFESTVSGKIKSENKVQTNYLNQDLGDNYSESRPIILSKLSAIFQWAYNETGTTLN